MVVDILSPTYWITELLGSIALFAFFLLIFVLYYASKKQLNFQWTVSLLVLTFLMLPLAFDSFLSWIPTILIVVGLIGGSILYRFLDRT